MNDNAKDGDTKAFDVVVTRVPREEPHVVTFEARGDRTEVSVTEYGYSSDRIADLSRADMEQCLDKMAAMLAGA